MPPANTITDAGSTGLAAGPTAGFEPFRETFAEQERAAEAEDGELADACYEQVRKTLTMSFPDGKPVAEFWLHVHGDGTAAWRWHNEPFGTADDAEGKPASIAADYP